MLIMHPLTTLHSHLYALITHKSLRPLELNRTHSPNFHGIELAEKNQFNLHPLTY